MKIFALRHGNTFGEDQKGGKRIFMLGSNNNLPLVQSGINQARDMCKYLTKINVIPTAIYSNTLVRIWEVGLIIREYFLYKHNTSIPLIEDDSLLELDYGDWAGLTTEDTNNEVIKKFGQDAWDDWQNKRIIPNYPPHNWKVTADDIKGKIKDLFEHLAKTYSQDDNIIVIGSQGSLTFLNTLFDGGMDRAIEEDRYKIKTGRFSEIEYKDGKWVLNSWNTKPTP